MFDAISLTLCLTLCSGWRNLKSYPVHFNASAECDKNERIFRAVLMTSGGELITSTDGTWAMSADSPVVSDCLYDGETYDARKEASIKGWQLPGFKASWAPASVLTCLNPIMSPITEPLIQV